MNWIYLRTCDQSSLVLELFSIILEQERKIPTGERSFSSCFLLLVGCIMHCSLVCLFCMTCQECCWMSHSFNSTIVHDCSSILHPIMADPDDHLKFQIHFLNHGAARTDSSPSFFCQFGSFSCLLLCTSNWCLCCCQLGSFFFCHASKCLLQCTSSS